MANSARDWLIDGAQGASSSEDVLAGVCDRLRADGVPVARADAYVRTLHPQFAGRAFVWQPGTGTRSVETDYSSTTAIEKTLIDAVRERRLTMRHRFGIDPPRCTFVAELEAAGATDVVGIPLLFLTSEAHVCTFATTRPGGYTDADVAAIEGVMAPLSRVAEILALRRVATNVLTAYVGRDAGARVLAGKIRRGDTELIEAAIWFSDMRGFSTASHDKRPEEVIAMLNELFDCQLPAIDRHGGEVLKFMGDGLLAIFTPQQAGGLRACCERALAASHEAIAAMRSRGTLRFGVALHVGEVAYGNIGGEARLDFTCIGRAVNLAARLESLTAKTGHDLLASEDFVRLVGSGFERVGEFEVKGFATPIAAYVPVRPG